MVNIPERGIVSGPDGVSTTGLCGCVRSCDHGSSIGIQISEFKISGVYVVGSGEYAPNMPILALMLFFGYYATASRLCCKALNMVTCQGIVSCSIQSPSISQDDVPIVATSGRLPSASGRSQ